MLHKKCIFNRLALTVLALFLVVSTVKAEPLWKQLIPQPKVQSDASSDYHIQQSSGPWLVMAATFSGEGAEAQARALVLELRSKHNLAAYVHSKAFDLASDAPLRSIDAYGKPKRSKYRHDVITEYAVLVGDFPSVDDVEAQRVLKLVKTLKPKALSGKYIKKTTQTLAGLRTMQNLMRKKVNPKSNRGPMAHAFLTRNPILPKDFFVPKGVDAFVDRMNSGVKHSLLDAPERYTLRVATFRGRTTLEGARVASSSKKKSKRKTDPLAVAAENAHLMVVALRARGWDEKSGWPAYEFHGRNESIVTIGSFKKGFELNARGQKVPSPEVFKVIRTFGAAYETPFQNPNQLATSKKVEQIKRQFSSTFRASGLQMAKGFHPKFIVGIPFDIYPEIIQAPKHSISSAYVR